MHMPMEHILTVELKWKWTFRAYVPKLRCIHGDLQCEQEGCAFGQVDEGAPSFLANA